MNSINIHNKSLIKESSLLNIAMNIFILVLAIVVTASPMHSQTSAIEVDTNIFLREARELQELIVNPGNEKYSRKNNPAVDLVERTRKNQSKGDPRLRDHYNYDQYDKITLGLLDIDKDDLKKHESLQIFLDTTPTGHRPMLKVLLNERASTVLYSGAGKNKKDVVRGKTSYGLSEMFDTGNIEVLLNDFLREVDIYDNDITLISNKFPSPLSSSGNLHYKYFITDTLDVGGTRCVQLTFMPRNPAEPSFSGNLFIELGDTTGFIRKVAMKVPRTVNLNFVDNLNLEQIYRKDSSGKRQKVSDRLSLDICIIDGTQRFSAARTTTYDNFSDEIRKDLLKAYEAVGSYIEIGSPSDSHGDLLTYLRGDKLSQAEANMNTFMGKLRDYPLFYWGEKVLMVLVTGYIKTAKKSKFDIGPINTLISTNPIEGVRLRLGGMTTANLSSRLFANGYVAYGTHDKKWKYKGEVEYSFNKKKYYSKEFPINSLSLTYRYDLDMIGQHYIFTNPDNVFLSLKRKTDKLATYQRQTRLEYSLDLNNNLSFSFWGEHIKQESSPWLPFTKGNGRTIPYYRRTSVGVAVRFAPGEKFILDNNGRVSVNKEAPLIQILQEWGPKGLRGCHYSVCKTELSAWKRIWFSSFGYLDALVKGGIIWSQVPYTELLWPNANLSYTIQPESYSLMNPMEFAMDRYVSSDLTYWGNGVLFNRIPFIKKAKFREVIEFKCLWGDLSSRNNPDLHKNLFRFPTDANISIMGKTPYMELSAGIDNIFKILRVDYVWRLTYLNTPGTDKSGIRVALHFNF